VRLALICSNLCVDLSGHRIYISSLHINNRLGGEFKLDSCNHVEVCKIVFKPHCHCLQFAVFSANK
jgi:hypothetical protein